LIANAADRPRGFFTGESAPYSYEFGVYHAQRLFDRCAPKKKTDKVWLTLYLIQEKMRFSIFCDKMEEKVSWKEYGMGEKSAKW